METRKRIVPAFMMLMTAMTLFAQNAASPAGVPSTGMPLKALPQPTVPEGAFRKPAIITSIGQNSDAAIVKVLCNTKLKLGFGYGILAGVQDLADNASILMVVGASTKGLGAAGISMEQEIARTKALIAAAKSKGIAVIAVHTGGSGRRGETSNQLIELVMADAIAAVVVAEGNKDGFFTELAAKRGIPLYQTETIAAAGAVIQTLFKQ